MASELRFVGRDAEIAVLRAAFDDSAGGRPRVVVVLGDLGVGKTRLVTEALRVVRPVARWRAPVPRLLVSPCPTRRSSKRCVDWSQSHRDARRSSDSPN
ncbi:MAG: AAA family ATPase [Dermatophilaceae bacterium]